MEELLGLRLVAGHLLIDPLLPDDWPSFSATYRRGTTTWVIAITRGDVQTTLNGVALTDHRIPLTDDGGTHHVKAQRSGQRTA